MSLRNEAATNHNRSLGVVGCGTIRQSTEAPDAKQEFKSSVSPDDSGSYTLTYSYTGDALTIELKTDGSFLIPPVGSVSYTHLTLPTNREV